jgi:protocatechuate 3,4-dioxygenase beta subunit
MAWERRVEATPACADADDVTPPETTGPFYKPNSPRRTVLREPGISGTPIVVKGNVLSTTCTPIAHALVDFWHADAQGRYDNAGYRLRGHQFTDNAGGYTLDTIVPGLYPGRTRHFHVRVQAPNQPVLTTQLYFPDEPHNREDWLFKPALLMRVQDTNSGQMAMFNFVLDERL